MSLRSLGSVLAVMVMVMGTFTVCFQGTTAEVNVNLRPVTQAATWAPLVPMKSAFVVKYDPDTYVDDYAYMASVPAAVFYDKENQVVYGAPLLYWEPSRGLSDVNLPQESYTGVNYFMQDWLNYTGKPIDNVQYINLGSDEISAVNGDWNMTATTSRSINSNDPYTIAKDIALYNWKRSDTAVVAVIDKTFPDKDLITNGSVQGSIPGKSPEIVVLNGEKEPGAINPNTHPFSISAGYKYVTSQMKWYGPTGSDQLASITNRGKDPDLQLYDMNLGEVGASEEWNVESGVGEYIGSYVYNDGEWQSAVSYMPTKSIDPLTPVQGKNISRLPPPTIVNNPLKDPRTLLGPSKPGSKVVYTITNTMYPGADVPLPDTTPFMARDGEFTLTWSGSDNLGFLIRGPSDAVIAEDLSAKNPKTLTIKDLGQGNYSITAVKLTDSSTAIGFNVSYKWHQYYEKRYGDAMASASEGAVLASVQNLPLLYASSKGLPSATVSALNDLGVTHVQLVDLGSNSKGKVKNELGTFRSLLQPKVSVDQYTSYTDVYSRIRSMTASNYIVFTTIGPYNYWSIDKGPVGEEKCGLFIGPATYAAAIHGTAVMITDAHSDLSTSVAWSNSYWLDAYTGRYPPSVGAMVLTGRAVYNWLNDVHYIKKTTPEYMMTVADQFNIGMSWDRTFVGVTVPGRIVGTPIDTSEWIARSAMYTAMIFSNPATGAGGIPMKTGSASKYENGLLQTSPAHDITATYPVVNTWVSYQHRFNERGSLYWGADYVTADGITPFVTTSGSEIDLNNKWPDLTTSEIVPHYAKVAGYTPVYSTNFDDTMTNLNKGSLLWLEVMHGGNRGSGVVGFWNPGLNPNEPDPWRGYESMGSTFEPDTTLMGRNIGFDVLKNPTQSMRGHDGVVIAIIEQSFQTQTYDGYQFDKAFGNLHSMGFNGGSCLIANTYMHLAMIRHGMIFEVIDPWLTSWYATFAMEAWLRDLDLGNTVGVAYEHGIQHVGIEYLVKQWWWDIFENVVYFGDPAMQVWMPIHQWDKPLAMPLGTMIGGHTPDGAPNHPNKIKSTAMMEYLIYILIIAGIAAIVAYTVYKIKTRPPRPKKVKKNKGAVKAKGMEDAASPTGTSLGVAKAPTKGKGSIPPPDKGKVKGGRWGSKGK